MPTGYTAIIDEEDATFEQYVWRCARAFGALIEMRDDPMAKLPPERFEPSPYHAEQAEKARADLRRYRKMTATEAEAAALKTNAMTLREREESVRRSRGTADRYAAMRAKVADWNPPTSGHGSLKAFMLEQLQTGAPFVHDGEPPRAMTGPDPPRSPFLHPRITSGTPSTAVMRAVGELAVSSFVRSGLATLTAIAST